MGLFDATSSWNGYNHQGKVALLLALIKLQELIRGGHDLDKWFLEIEWTEDFSIGYFEPQEGTNKKIYKSIHQVKARSDDKISDYKEALIELSRQVLFHKDVDEVCLHTRTDLNISAFEWSSSLDSFLKKADETIQTNVKIIQDIIDDEEKQQALLAKGKKSELYSKLKAYSQDLSTVKQVVESAEKYRDELLTSCGKLSSMTATEQGKVRLYQYNDKFYCKLDEIENLILTEIKNYVKNIMPSSRVWEMDRTYLERRYIYLLSYFDSYIIKRHRDGTKCDKEIVFSELKRWLETAEISKQSRNYFLSYYKNEIISMQQIYCNRCRDYKLCEHCELPKYMERISLLHLEEFEPFFREVNPHIHIKLEDDFFLKNWRPDGYYNPLFEGLKLLNRKFKEKYISAAFVEHNELCMLSTIMTDGGPSGKEAICSQIVLNDAAAPLLMDYNVFISRNIESESILADAGDFIGLITKDGVNEHIAHCKMTRLKMLTSYTS